MTIQMIATIKLIYTSHFTYICHCMCIVLGAGTLKYDFVTKIQIKKSKLTMKMTTLLIRSPVRFCLIVETSYSLIKISFLVLPFKLTLNAFTNLMI